MFIGSRRSPGTRLVGDLPGGRAVVVLFFSCRSAGALQEKITPGGAVETRLKGENGARLTEPSGPMVLIQPIGRGATMALNRLRLKSGVFSGSMNNMGRLRFQALQP